MITITINESDSYEYFIKYKGNEFILYIPLDGKVYWDVIGDILIILNGQNNAEALFAYKNLLNLECTQEQLAMNNLKGPFSCTISDINFTDGALSNKELRSIIEMMGYHDEMQRTYGDDSYELSEKHRKAFLDFIFEVGTSRLRGEDD